MTPFIHFLIMRNMYFPVSLCGDNCVSAAPRQILAQMIGVERFVAEKSIKTQPFNQGRHTNNLAALTGKQAEADEITQGIRECEDFRRQAAFRTPDGLILSPPFAPLAF